jgi:hypothetical protein
MPPAFDNSGTASSAQGLSMTADELEKLVAQFVLSE